jgi:hypothetical protein
MQRHQQLCCGFRVRSSVRSRFATWQLWPLAVTVLRSGLIFTKGHPFQGPGGRLCEFIGVFEFRGLWGPVGFLA